MDRPNQVRRADITYLPMRKGFLYLVAIMDWLTRKALAWRKSNSIEAEFCREALQKFGPPEIMNTDQGSQVTSFEWTDRLKRANTNIFLSAISRNRLPATDGRQSPLSGHIFIKSLWRSLKYGWVYLHPWETGSQARAGVGRWITFYNHLRLHAIRREIAPPDQFLILLKHGGHTPAVVCFNTIETDQQMQAVA